MSVRDDCGEEWTTKVVSVGTAATLALLSTGFDVQRFVCHLQQAAKVVAFHPVFVCCDDLGIVRCRIHQARNSLEAPSIGKGKPRMNMVGTSPRVIFFAFALLLAHSSS